MPAGGYSAGWPKLRCHTESHDVIDEPDSGIAPEVSTVTAEMLDQLHATLRRASPTRLGFTRQAFHLLPELDNPLILDVGCGVGGPTLELVRLSGGIVIGLDIDQAALDELALAAEEGGLSDRIQVVHGSMRDMDFPEESLDVIWSEGSVHIVGFREALQSWRRFIKPRGFLVVHEGVWLRPDPSPEIATCWQLAYPGMQTVPEHVASVPGLGYDLIAQFSLPEDFWWTEYFAPLEVRIRRLQRKHAGDAAALAALEREQRVVDLYKKHARWYGSAFFVMQRSRS